jgi:hypothetical protein
MVYMNLTVFFDMKDNGRITIFMEVVSCIVMVSCFLREDLRMD